jgi:hypothetical protein
MNPCGGRVSLQRKGGVWARWKGDAVDIETYLELEEDIRDVEDCQEPFVAIRRQIEIFGHTSDLSIANVSSIEEREQD